MNQLNNLVLGISRGNFVGDRNRREQICPRRKPLYESYSMTRLRFLGFNESDSLSNKIKKNFGKYIYRDSFSEVMEDIVVRSFLKEKLQR